MTNNFDSRDHEEFLNSLIAGNRNEGSNLLSNYLNQPSSIKELYENIIKKALYDIGELWEYNKISVATEHLASAIVEALMNDLYPNIVSSSKSSKTVVVACVENEYHQIGIKMVSDIFEMNGWNTFFLGANIPTEDLISYAKKIKPDLLAFSLSIYFHLPILESMIQKIRVDFPDLPIIIGGQAFRFGGQEALLKYDQVVYLPDLDSIELYIKNL